jgi:hypothetical protein
MTALYDPETDGSTVSELADIESSAGRNCEYCGGKGKVMFGYGGYDFIYDRPSCKGEQ